MKITKIEVWKFTEYIIIYVPFKIASLQALKDHQKLYSNRIYYKYMNNFKLANADTDSISFYKSNQEPFTIQERQELLNDLNSKCSNGVIWEDDGYFVSVIIIKAKNYVLYDGKSIKYKGSALKSPKLEKALNEFIHKIVESIIYEKNNYIEIYNEYVKEIDSVKDIHRWSSRYTISQKTLESERTNESKIRDALEGSEYVEGDRIYCYFRKDDSLCLVENYKNNYNKERLYKKLHNTALRFATILDKTQFVNYSLKKSKKILEEILSK
jgi:hypothetical protein